VCELVLRPQPRLPRGVAIQLLASRVLLRDHRRLQLKRRVRVAIARNGPADRHLKRTRGRFAVLMTNSGCVATAARMHSSVLIGFSAMHAATAVVHCPASSSSSAQSPSLQRVPLLPPAP
jgi:hypothetical protein